MDYFDLAQRYGGVLGEAFRESQSRFCVISFTTDWLYPATEGRKIVHALNSVAANVSFAEIESEKGHDAFTEEPEFWQVLNGFRDGAAEYYGLSTSEGVI